MATAITVGFLLVPNLVIFDPIGLSLLATLVVATVFLVRFSTRRALID